MIHTFIIPLINIKYQLLHFLGDLEVLLPVELRLLTVCRQSSEERWSLRLPYLRTIILAIFSVIVMPVLSLSLRRYSNESFP